MIQKPYVPFHNIDVIVCFQTYICNKNSVQESMNESYRNPSNSFLSLYICSASLRFAVQK